MSTLILNTFEQTIEDNEDTGRISYIKLINVGQKIITRNCTGFLPSQVAFYLQNIHIEPRKIFLSLNADSKATTSEFILRNISSDKLNLNSPTYANELSKEGFDFATKLADYIQLETSDIEGLGAEILILTGTADLEKLTVADMSSVGSTYHTPLLNELRAGDFHGLSKDVFKVLKKYTTTHFETTFINFGRLDSPQSLKSGLSINCNIDILALVVNLI